MYRICVQGIRLLKNTCCSLTQRMHCQKPRESLGACAPEGSSRVLLRVLTMTFSDFWVLNHATKIPLNVVFLFRNKSLPPPQWVCFLDFPCVLRQGNSSVNYFFFQYDLQVLKDLTECAGKKIPLAERETVIVLALQRRKHPYYEGKRVWF